MMKTKFDDVQKKDKHAQFTLLKVEKHENNFWEEEEKEKEV